MPSSRATTLQDLLGAGMLQPKEAALTLTYNARTTAADLLSDGSIALKEAGSTQRVVFATLSSFALHVIRKTFPGRRAVSGWHSVKYKGQYLLEIRAQFEEAGNKRGKKKVSKQTSRAKTTASLPKKTLKDKELPVIEDIYVSRAEKGQCPMQRLNEDALQHILCKLPARDWFHISAASRQLAAACELLFLEEVKTHPEWKRRTAKRSQTMRLEKCFPFRSIYWLNACRICCEPGTLDIVRSAEWGTVHVCWFCKRCMRSLEGVSWLVRNRCSITRQ